MLQIEQLSCVRGERALFSKLSFTVSAGEVLQVVGPNGCGKSSLLNILTGLGRLEAGEVQWNGSSIHNPESNFRNEMNWLGHQLGIKSALSPSENLEFYAGLINADCDIDRTLLKVGLLDFADMPCQALSAGQNRRTALARLLIAPRSLWILDEPFSGLDVDGQSLLCQLLADHVQNGGLVVLTAHHDVAIPGVDVRELALGEFV